MIPFCSSSADECRRLADLKADLCRRWNVAHLFTVVGSVVAMIRAHITVAGTKESRTVEAGPEST
jgi:hypothetical protein